MGLIQETPQMTENEKMAVRNSNGPYLEHKIDYGDEFLNNSKLNLGTTLYHNPNGLQITAGMNIPLTDDTSKYTHLLFDMYAGEGTGKRPHITEASGEIVFTATNLVNAPSSSTYHAIFEAVLQVSTNSISVTSFRRVAVSSGSTYTPSYDENVTAASWTIYRIIGLQFMRTLMEALLKRIYRS